MIKNCSLKFLFFLIFYSKKLLQILYLWQQYNNCLIYGKNLKYKFHSHLGQTAKRLTPMGIRICATSSLSRIFSFYCIFHYFSLFSLDVVRPFFSFFFFLCPIGQFNKTENGIISNVTRFPGHIIDRSISLRINLYTVVTLVQICNRKINDPRLYKFIFGQLIGRVIAAVPEFSVPLTFPDQNIDRRCLRRSDFVRRTHINCMFAAR